MLERLETAYLAAGGDWDPDNKGTHNFANGIIEYDFASRDVKEICTTVPRNYIHLDGTKSRLQYFLTTDLSCYGIDPALKEDMDKIKADLEKRGINIKKTERGDRDPTVCVPKYRCKMIVNEDGDKEPEDPSQETNLVKFLVLLGFSDKWFLQELVDAGKIMTKKEYSKVLAESKKKKKADGDAPAVNLNDVIKCEKYDDVSTKVAFINASGMINPNPYAKLSLSKFNGDFTTKFIDAQTQEVITANGDKINNENIHVVFNRPMEIAGIKLFNRGMVIMHNANGPTMGQFKIQEMQLFRKRYQASAKNDSGSLMKLIEKKFGNITIKRDEDMDGEEVEVSDE